MIRTILLGALAAAMLAACTPGPGTSDNYQLYHSEVSGALGGYSEAAGDASKDRVLAQLESPPAPQQSGPTRHIAVTRGFTLRLPSNEVAAVQQRHLSECAKLGCIVQYKPCRDEGVSD